MSDNKDKVRVGKAAEILGITVQTLRNWEKSGKLVPERSQGGQRYYKVEELKRFALDLEKLGWSWAASQQAPELPDEYYCERHDRFSSRLEKMSNELSRLFLDDSESLVSLLTLVAAEIGDNSFAHNVGNWPDVPGVFYAYDLNKRLIVLADRGRGVRATLQRVRPALASDDEALHVAFTEIVSGRDPERRGNGLKVIRRVVETEPIGLLFRSGTAMVRVSKESGSMRISLANENVRGVYSVIKF